MKNPAVRRATLRITAWQFFAKLLLMNLKKGNAMRPQPNQLQRYLLVILVLVLAALTTFLVWLAIRDVGQGGVAVSGSSGSIVVHRDIPYEDACYQRYLALHADTALARQLRDAEVQQYNTFRVTSVLISLASRDTWRADSVLRKAKLEMIFEGKSYGYRP